MKRNKCVDRISTPVSHWNCSTNDYENSRAHVSGRGSVVGEGYPEYNSYNSYNYYITRTYGANSENEQGISRISGGTR